ncbi:hypothetical protein COB21_02340 [Candidatus Aerophobetes bacterium]|uniref:Uncharacterized protein n=1 Tax=Aerophobetes bacterium TaxID=2030807 RepID=A0A2A4X5Y5_UNCAE|nr:MAG: hypothetical protein COB21_02340 [Candidatus Aerophobetes bacterium]
MKKINDKILCIPPFISTAWDNIKSLHCSEGSLVVTLISGTEINIPNLTPQTLEDIFKTHTEHLEGTKDPHVITEKKVEKERNSLFSFDLPFNFDSLGDVNALMNCTQHDMKLSHSDPLPPDLLDKVTKMAAMMGFDTSRIKDLKAEPHCNCPHCQVVRSINKVEDNATEAPSEEMVTDKDLKFREWDIKEMGEKRYKVSNPFDKDEKYQVFLGDPVGCTCGKKHCEHLKVVLES